MQKKDTRSKINKGLIIIGSLFIVLGLLIIITNYLFNYFQNKHEKDLIKTFYEVQENIDFESITINNEEEVIETSNSSSKIDYIAVIKIPKIGFEKGLCAKYTYCNYVDRNVQILNEANFPDIENGNFILAGHSGTSSVAYFKNLYKLELYDEISIFYNGKEYKYQVKNIYDIEKTGTADIVRNMNKTTLTLITCRKGTDKQIVIICELVETIGGNE